MDWSKVFDKGLKGLLTVLASIIIANQQGIQDYVMGLLDKLPIEINPEMTIAGVVGAAIVAITNIIKHWGK